MCIYIYMKHSSINGHLGCFQAVTIVNSAAMNTGVYVSSQIRFFVFPMSRSGIAESRGFSFFKETPYHFP